MRKNKCWMWLGLGFWFCPPLCLCLTILFWPNECNTLGIQQRALLVHPLLNFLLFRATSFMLRRPSSRLEDLPLCFTIILFLPPCPSSNSACLSCLLTTLTQTLTFLPCLALFSSLSTGGINRSPNKVLINLWRQNQRKHICIAERSNGWEVGKGRWVDRKRRRMWGRKEKEVKIKWGRLRWKSEQTHQQTWFNHQASSSTL